MNIQIKEIILWPIKKEHSPRRIEFSDGAVNVIHGLSQTGKSAIIHIIDYCLCTTENKIPIGVIRDNVDWFGVILKFNDEEILLARQNLSKTNFKMHFSRAKNIEITEVPQKNVNNKDEFKKYINNLMGISFFENQQEHTYKNRISFRDLVAFNFQTQSIVASANCLLYKSDLSDYRDRIKKIFGVALGIDTPKNMMNKITAENLTKELDRVKNELERNKTFFEEQLLQYKDIIFKAMKYGIIKERDVSDNIIEVRTLLEEIVNKKVSDINLSSEGEEKIAKAIISLDNEIKPIYNELKDYEIKKHALMKTIDLQDKVSTLSNERIDRLSISQFIKKFCLENPEETSVVKDLDSLCSNLARLEEENMMRNINNSRCYSELSSVNEKIKEINEKINNLLFTYKNLSDKKSSNILEEFISEIAKAKNLLEFYKYNDKKLLEKIDWLEKEIINYPYKNINDTEAFAQVIRYAKEYLPGFEEFKNLDSFDKENLTIKILKDGDDVPYFMSETGSASNWLAYHLAVLLAFHKYFILNSCSCFNFIIFDQPTQAFFPKEIPNDEKDLKAIEDGNENSDKNEIKQEIKTDDVKSVKKIFEIFSKVSNELSPKLQIIVLDHADPKVWGKYNNVFEIEDWSKSRGALIPKDWL